MAVSSLYPAFFLLNISPTDGSGLISYIFSVVLENMNELKVTRQLMMGQRLQLINL